MSNRKWGIWAIRSPNSVCGYGAAWAKSSKGGRDEFDTEDEAKAAAKEKNAQLVSTNVTYFAKEIDDAE